MSFEEKLINLVKQNEILYNKSSRGYKNTHKKFETWKKIGMELGESDETCLLRWKSLRDRYSRELKSKQQPSGSKAKYKEEWEYFQNILFLTDFIKNRNSISNFTDTHKETGDEIEYTDLETFTSVSEFDLVSRKRSSISSNCDEVELGRKDNLKKKRSSSNEDGEKENYIKTTLSCINNMLQEQQSATPEVKNPDDEIFVRMRAIFDGLREATKKQAASSMLKYLCEFQIKDIETGNTQYFNI